MTKSWRAGCARALAASCLALILLAFAGLPASANSIDRHAFVGHVRTARAVVNHLGPTRSIYVSPSGNDRNPGTARRPLRHLQYVRNLVRSLDQNMKKDIKVVLLNGTYRLAHPLRLGPQDSGTNGHDVIWSAAPGAHPVISGAVRIRNWRLHDHRKNIWVAKVPAWLQSRQVYVNGMRASVAAGPVPVGLTATDSGYIASSGLMASWRNPQQIEFVYTGGRPMWNVKSYGLGNWSEPRCPVASITGNTIAMAQPCWDNSTKRVFAQTLGRTADLVGPNRLTGGAQPAYVENAFPLLDEPGEFYLDTSAHLLYYIPRRGENMNAADVEVPALEALITGAGTQQQPIHDLVFQNLQFAYATWLQPSSPQGFSEVQANYTITGDNGYATQGLCQFADGGACPYGAWTREPGNVDFRYDQNIAFLEDQFVHLGAAALNLDDGSQNDTVQGSVFTDVSGNGIELGGVDMPQAVGPDQTVSNSIIDNHLYGLPVEYHGGVAILVGYAAGTLISHNQIDHTPYTAISIGWGGWPDKVGQPALSNFSHDNVVSYNRIYDDMETLTDGGGIYTQGITGTSMDDGEKIVGNVIYSQLDWGYALYTDNGASFVTMSGNVAYDNNYDWGIKHLNTVTNDGTYDPLLVEDNYWQQGDPDSTSGSVVQSGNVLIPGPEAVPASVLSNAGLEPQFQSILMWRPSRYQVPNSPYRVAAYAGDGKAYVTWRPSYAEGTSPVTSYTVTSCARRSRSIGGRCSSHGYPQARISAADLNRLGYVELPGLTNGRSYSFQVTAHSSAGSSTPSIPSPGVKPAPVAATLPSQPTIVTARPGPQSVQVRWYSPVSDGGQPVTGYVVTSSTGQQYTVTSLRQLIVSFSRGDNFYVVGGLTTGQSYTFSVAAITPVGIGPAAVSTPVTPS